MDKDTQALIDSGDIEVCPACGGLSAYCHADVDETKGIAHIGATSCFEWECGHCHTHWTDADSPINAECYTHNSE